MLNKNRDRVTSEHLYPRVVVFFWGVVGVGGILPVACFHVTPLLDGRVLLRLPSGSRPTPTSVLLVSLRLTEQSPY